MSPKNTANHQASENLTVPVLKELVSEFKTLKKEIQDQRLQEVKLPPEASPEILKSKLYFSLDRLGGERKPFILRAEGLINIDLKLSSIRAAIVLVLLLDLQDRIEGGPGISGIIEKVIEFYLALDPAASQIVNIKNVTRVGLYRFEFFLQEVQRNAGTKSTLVFKPIRPSLEIKSPQASYTEITIASTDQSILLLLEKNSKISPLSRLRRNKSMYVPTADGGWEQLFLEFIDNDCQIVSTNLFYRFSLVTYPDSLLHAIGASPATFARKRIMLEGYTSGRIQFVEYLSRETLWDTVTQTADGSFKLYPEMISSTQVVEHLQYVIHKVETYDNYKLILTSAPFPFNLGTIEMYKDRKTEMFTMFYRQYLRESVLDRSCLALNDQSTAVSVQMSVVSSVKEHASTCSDRPSVIKEIKQVIEHLKNRNS